MKDLTYVLANFFTHKDFLAPADQIPGTLFTPLQFVFEAVLLTFILGYALYLSRHQDRIRTVFKRMWIALVVWEFLIILWDSTAGMVNGLDVRQSLSFYPCSIFLYALPLVLWGKGLWKQAACGYIYTLGLLGALVNFLYPFSRLADYSCLSFPAFHTFFFHGSMLFTFFTMLFSGMHSYGDAQSFRDLLIPSLLSMIMSVPANLINYRIGADYMYFRGKIFILANVFGRTPSPVITGILYVLYVAIPALFYLPGYLHNRGIAAEPEQELLPALPDLKFSWHFTD